MALILDANVLINLYRADILQLVFQGVECIIAAEVYEEVIIGGRRAGHSDAIEIGEILGPSFEPATNIPTELASMGLGEAASLSLYMERQGEVGSDDDYIISDDQQFLNYLERREVREGVEILHLSTAGLIAELGLGGVLNKVQALDALEKIRDRIRAVYYQAARQRLEGL